MTDPDAHDDMPDEEFDETVLGGLDEDDEDGFEDTGLDEDGEEGEEEGDESGPARNATMVEDEDGDGEDIDPDNVEADLDTILKDRLAAGDDEEEDEETPEPSPETSGQVAPKRDNEWTCEGCFLIVTSSQFGLRGNPQCPSGEDPCPSLARL
ncbi:MAG: hypothetical protein OXF04_06210 [bacterium]|nr:hypothetical protein [bacterium]MCY4273205.1 hypothetical protein [bacterium]